MKPLLFLMVFFLPAVVAAQDPVFSQHSYGLSFINPAYAGSLACTRLETGYGFTRTAADCTMQTTNAAFDFFFEGGGINLNYMHDVYDQKVQTDRFDFNYSYGFGIGTAEDGRSKVVVQPAFQLSVYSKRISLPEPYSSAADRYGTTYKSYQYGLIYSEMRVDISGGVLLSSKHAMVGLAYYHWNSYDYGYFVNSAIPRRLTIHGAFILGNADPLSTKLSIIPSVIIMHQNEEDYAHAMILVKYKNFRAGYGYNTEEIGTMLVGYTYKHATVSYSLNIPAFASAEYGPAHEVHLSYLLNTEKWTAGLLNTQAFL